MFAMKLNASQRIHSTIKEYPIFTRMQTLKTKIKKSETRRVLLDSDQRSMSRRR